MATNENFELARTIAAFGGLGLGVANLGLLIYKDYLRKPKFEVTVKRAIIRAAEPGLFDLQIDIDMCAKCGNVNLKELCFEHEVAVFGPDRELSKRLVHKLIQYPGHLLLTADKDKFNSMAEELHKEADLVSAIKLEENEHRLFSVIDRVSIDRYMDGFWDWPKSGWELVIQTSAGKVCVPFSFNIHETNKHDVFTHAY